MTMILLDTTYIFPIAGIDVHDVERDAVKKAIAAGHQLSISEMSLFELAAKGAKLVRNGSVEAERLTQAVQSIASDERLRKIQLYQDGVLPLAINLRRHHSDFMDCVILASAVSACEILVTEDESLAHDSELIKLARKARPEFSVSTFKRLLANGK
jgi:predicted nucleic acid-binding protein